MIELTFEEFCLWVVGVPLLGVGIYCFFSALKYRALAARQRQGMMRCRVCGNMYRELRREKIVECPQCGAANEKGRSRRLG